MKKTMLLLVLFLVLGLVSSASAQLPAGWSQTDIGGTSPAGSASYDQVTGTWTVIGDGADIWDTSDSFHFVFRSLKGDGMMTARVVSIAGAGLNEWAKAGVMIREILSAKSMHAMTVMTPGSTQNHAAQFQWRPTTGGLSDRSQGGSMNLPYWVRIQRMGNTLRGYISPNGSTWTQQGTDQTISMSQTVYFGLVAHSHVPGQLLTAKFDNVTIQAEVPAKAITYQGRLLDGDLAADGLYDLQFNLYDAQTSGSQKGQTVDIEDMDVIGGYFTVDLDFGEGVFDGNPRWLQIAVRPGASTGQYTVLDPRQRIAPTPYALYAFSAADSGGEGDDLGNHTATQNINLNGHYLSGDGGNEGIYVDSDGKIGIGTSNPQYTLDIAGPANLNTSDGVALRVNGASAIKFYNGMVGALTWGEGAVSNTFTRSVTIESTLRVYSDAYFYGVYVGGNLGIGMSDPTYRLDLPNTATAMGRGRANGWVTYSSGRWKTNIDVISDPVEKVKKLRGVYFDWKETGTHDIGLIAEEVAEVIPEVVGYEKDSGNAESLDYGRLVALLVEAVKEQQAQMEQQDAERTELRAENAALKKTIADMVSRLNKIETTIQISRDAFEGARK
jgi:hypothetical protein